MFEKGHWFGDKREFNFLTVFNMSKAMAYVQSRMPNYDKHFEVLKSAAIISAHSELTAQAYYLGNNTEIFACVYLYL